jgi:hypothetical protein
VSRQMRYRLPEQKQQPSWQCLHNITLCTTEILLSIFFPHI